MSRFSSKQIFAVSLGSLAFAGLVAAELATPSLFFDISPGIGDHGHDAALPADGRPCPAAVEATVLRAGEVSWEVRPQERIDAWAFGGTVPGPIICAKAGGRVAVTVANELPRPLDFHLHGLEPLDGAWPTLAPGAQATRTYAIPEEGGAFAYHGLGEAALLAGLHGVLLAPPEDGVRADREYVLVLSEFDADRAAGRFHAAVNGRTYPSVPRLEAVQGETVRVHLLNLGAADHTLHIHGHRWHDAGDGRPIDNKYLAPHDGEDPKIPSQVSYVLRAEEAGDWMYHCHIYDHINAGMTGVFRVHSKGGGAHA